MIPKIDFRKWQNPATKHEFVKELGDAFNYIGFATITNHPFPKELRLQLREVVEKFFALPEEIKLKYHKPEVAGQRGYTPRFKEHAKDQNVPDLKEFYQIGQEIPEDVQDSLQGYYGPNIWPQEIPGFKEITWKVYRTMENIGRELLRAIALYLDLEENYFDDKVLYGESILRLLYYPPLSELGEFPEGAIRAAAHGDINLITLLMGSSAEGLQVLNRENQWIPINAEIDDLAINVGDMLERLTNNRLRSTIHRVVNPPNATEEPRYSFPFFMHPRPEMSLACLPSCITPENPKQYEDITAGEFLEQRLKEIGLK